MTYLLFFIALLVAMPAGAQSAEAMLLLKTWQPGQHVDGWLMSEKLDGVRARWDGHHLVSRGDHIFAAPDWFTEGLPPFALDGELWSRRGDFEHIVSIVRKKTPHAGWKQLTYQIFEVPDQPGGLLRPPSESADSYHRAKTLSWQSASANVVAATGQSGC